MQVRVFAHCFVLMICFQKRYANDNDIRFSTRSVLASFSKISFLKAVSEKSISQKKRKKCRMGQYDFKSMKDLSNESKPHLHILTCLKNGQTVCKDCREVLHVLNKLPVYRCENFENGCKYANTSLECEDHIKGCTFSKVNCPYTSCSEDVENHLRNLHQETLRGDDETDVNIPSLLKAPLKTRAKFVQDESDLSDNEYAAEPSELGVHGEQLSPQIVARIDAQTSLLKGLGLLPDFPTFDESGDEAEVEIIQGSLLVSNPHFKITNHIRKWILMSTYMSCSEDNILFKNDEDYFKNLHQETLCDDNQGCGGIKTSQKKTSRKKTLLKKSSVNKKASHEAEVNIPRLKKAPLKTRAKFVDDESDLSDNEYAAEPTEPGVHLSSQIVTGIDTQTSLLKGLGLLPDFQTFSRPWAEYDD